MQDLLDALISGDDERAERSISAIVEMGADAIPPLVELTRSRDSDSRWWAVRALAELTETNAADLIPLLLDPSPDVRAAAALALCTHPDEAAIPALVCSLADEDAITAGLAVTALVNIGKPAVQSLVETLENRAGKAPLNARIFAARALGEIRDHRAIPALMKAQGEESALLQYWAQIGLEKLGLDMVYIKP